MIYSLYMLLLPQRIIISQKKSIVQMPEAFLNFLPLIFSVIMITSFTSPLHDGEM